MSRRGFVEVPAKDFRDMLTGDGFALSPRSRTEEVWEKPVADGAVLVYTSIARNGETRGCGADAIRVCGVRGEAGVAKTTRVHRTGDVDAVFARVRARVVEVERVLTSTSVRTDVATYEQIEREAIVNEPKADPKEEPMRTRSEAVAAAETPATIAPVVVDATPAWERSMNEEQLEAIRHTYGPCRLLAGPGSGKTRAAVHRIARLVADGVCRGERILAVTFARKAADEMEERLASLGVNSARVGTWHSLCGQILKDDMTTWSTWEVEGDKDAMKWALKDVVGFRGLDWKQADLRQLRSWVGREKANLRDPSMEECADSARAEFGSIRDGAGRPAWRLALDAFDRAQRAVEDKRILTFDDMLVFTARHLQDPSARARWGSKFDFVICDEYQDNNLAQETIARALAGEHQNYMAIGDCFQAIYSFRGSTPRYLAELPTLWPGMRTIEMGRNYRSGSKIVDVTNAITKVVTDVPAIEIKAAKETAGDVQAVLASDSEAEGEAFGDWVQEHLARGGKATDIACLFRLNALSRAPEEALIKRQIPYVVVGGTSFYDRREVKDLLSYLRVAVGLDREGDAVKRCINAPFRFLGKAFVDRIEQEWTTGCDASEVVLRVAQQERLQSRQRESAVAWAQLIAGIRLQMTRDAQIIKARDEGQEPTIERGEVVVPRGPAGILEDLVAATNYIAHVEKEEGQESIETSGAANVREIIRVAAKFPTVKALLDYIEKQQMAAKKQRRDRQAGGDRVVLMSAHKAKGLEFERVWVVGMNEGVLPHAKGDEAEERRIAYVAVSRAKSVLRLSYVREGATRQGVRLARPSRFLIEAGLVVNEEC